MNILALVLVVLPLAACQLIGGPKTADVKRDDVQQMASFALTQLNILLGSQNTLVSVVQAKTQVVAGINYFLTLKIKNGQETQICTVTVWSRVWLNDKQVTQHACTSRTKRDGLLGAPTSVNVTVPPIWKMATYAVTTLNGLQGTVNSLDQVISAKIQVVAGTNYFLKIRVSDGSQTQICDVTIWDQPWSYMTQLTHHSCVDVKKRDIAMPGGFTDVDVNSTGVRNMTNFALGEINKLFSEQLSLIEIISAKTQVVAGINYFLKFRVRNGNLNEICDVTIWEQLWTQTTHMTHSSCTSVASKRDILMPGGLTNVDINSTEVRDMASFALGEINGLQGAQNTMEQVISAKAQVVAGINYFLTLEIKNGQETQICTVTVWSRVWLNDKQVTQHACTSRAKRDGLLGAPTSVNVTGPDILKMATYAVTTLNGLQGTDNSLDQVISAKIQVVAGTNYFLKIRVSDGSQTQICDVTIWDQPWSYMTQLTHHSCVDVKKRDIAMPGGFTDVDVNSTGVRNMTNFALGEINKLFSEQLSLIEIISAKTQVVAGINYFLKFRVRNGNLNEICDVTIWEQLWTQTTHMTHSSCTSVASKRDILMPGGLTNVDINSTEVRDMASFALGEINGLQGAQNTMEQVISAKAQVVAGINYFLTLEIKNGQETQICTVTVWSRVWLNDKQVTQHACTSRAKRDGLLGAPTSVNVTGPDILKMATYAVTTLNGLQGTDNSLDQVISAKIQVVAGTNYFLKIRVSDGSQTQICDVTIWDQPWSYMTQLTHHSCVDVKKRDIAMPGGFTDVDVNSTGVRNMTNFALGEINKLFSEQLSLIEIISAKTQVIAGINYFLKFRVRNGNLNEICDVTISEQLWTQATKMTHSSCTSVGSKRDILMPGGLTNVDINSTEVRDMASFALGEINGLQGAQNTMEQVISAKAQVVSGMNYMLTIRLKEGYKTQICYVKIWSQPWLHRKEMTEHSCSQVTKRAGGLLGGPTGVDVNSAEIQEVANFAVTEINGIQGAQNSLVKVVNARKQIVSGINYILTLNLQNGDKRMTCRVAVLYQAWSDPKFQLLSDTCGQLA